jgi:DNA-binding response OmpR family regulator
MSPAVLIVDDEPRIFNALSRALHRENYELLSAPDAEQALAILAERSVDVIIADENMPGMKGSALLARVRQRWPDVMRMMLTGDARLETIVAAVNRAEIFRFFIKPCNEVELLVSIRDALKERKARGATPSAQESAPAPAPAPAVATEQPSAPAPIVLDADETTDAPTSDRKVDLSKTDCEAENTGEVFRLEGTESADSVDSLLDQISSELEKLDS